MRGDESLGRFVLVPDGRRMRKGVFSVERVEVGGRRLGGTGHGRRGGRRGHAAVECAAWGEGEKRNEKKCTEIGSAQTAQSESWRYAERRRELMGCAQ